MRRTRPLWVLGSAVAIVVPSLVLLAKSAAEDAAAPLPPTAEQCGQPIAYSHATHAGKYKIDCLYCHYAAERGRHAGVPPASVCMNCHTQVKTDSEEVKKIQAAIETGRPIVWNRIHRLPDHTHFDHSRHVLAGGLKCQECHGPVEAMDRVEPRANLAMGQCLECHRKAGRDERSKVAPAIDCSGCHY